MTAPRELLRPFLIVKWVAGGRGYASRDPDLWLRRLGVHGDSREDRADQPE